MMLKTILLALATAALTASAAFGAPPVTHSDKGKGVKPPTTGTGCKPEVMVVLHGTVATAPGATPTLPFSLMLNISSANHAGAAFAKAAQPLPVSVTLTTKVSRQGAKSL